MNKIRSSSHMQFLSDELSRRKEKNPRYSLRAFAAHLEIDPAALSRILSGKQDLSIHAAVKAAPKLNFSDEDRHQFLLSVAKDHISQTTEMVSKIVALPLEENALRSGSETTSISFEAFNLVADHVSVLDRDGTFLFVNPRVATTISQLTGTVLKPADFVGRKASAFGLRDDLCKAFRAQEETVLALACSDSREYHIHGYQGQSQGIHMERGVSPVLAEDGKVAFLIVLGKDITQRKKLEIQVDQLQKIGRATQAIVSGLVPAMTQSQVGKVVIDRAFEAMRVLAAGCYLVNEEKDVLELLTSKVEEQSPELPAAIISLDGDHFTTQSYRSRQSVWIPSYSDLANAVPTSGAPLLRKSLNEAGSAVAIPMKVGDQVIGVLSFILPVGVELDPLNRDFLLLATDLCTQAMLRAGMHGLGQWNSAPAILNSIP